MTRLIWLPEDCGFWETLHGTLPPNWRNEVSSDFSGDFVVKTGSYCLTPVSPKELTDYLEGGEYDEFDYIEGWVNHGIS